MFFPKKHLGEVAVAFVATLVLAGLLATTWASNARRCAPWNQVTLSIETSPAGAAVFVNGRPVGQTPARVKVCRGAPHHVRVTRPEHVSWEWRGVPTGPLALDARLLERADVHSVPR